MTAEYTAEALYTVGEKETCLTAVRDLQRDNPEVVLFNRPLHFEWVDVTTTEFLDQVYAVAKGLIANGVGEKDRVAIMSETRYEWSLLDFAIMAAGAISVPIYPSSSTGQCEWIIQNSGAILAIGETSDHTYRLETFLGSDAEHTDETKPLRRVLGITGGAVDILIEDGKNAEVSQEVVEQRIAGVRSEDVATLVYTSGTTGKPKGCRLTHHNLLSECRGLLTNPIGKIGKPGCRSLTFLPLAHVLSRCVSLTMVVSGATQSHWADFGTLVTEFQRSQPHMILGVPRVFEKVHQSAKAKATDGGGPQAKIFLAAEKTAQEYSRALDEPSGPSLLLKARHKVFDKLVYSRVREAMGGELLYCISGGSALNPDLMHFFRGVGVLIYEGYGLTESTAAIAVNHEQSYQIGTVGRPVGGNTIKIADDGEILLKGNMIFQGYWKNEEATKENFTEDGFYLSGDVGKILPNGHLKITGRKKEILVTAGGKNVSPGPMEDILRSAPLISQAMVVGDDQKFVGALITLDEEAAKKWKSANGVPANTSMRELAKNPKLRNVIQDAVNEANQSVSHAEGIKRFRIVDRDFTEEKGEMTPSMKIKRFVIAKNFADDIAWIYKNQ
ncbi:AMP-dependent synthetase/ligase [Corynebacterium heidelbergense]|uniref:Acyl-CoA synthetase n=1 Tax=Corynebacterium heidelbergense TaxID=2055947 RepID=A0A364V8W7_9CORY|nr:long-chain fatty acid--CoA ligase [Corynebacterium heidelbergense]RAV33102.1 long-chain fatty acid--CoA ligase [Corynebacterium heidelbergense]